MNDDIGSRPPPISHDGGRDLAAELADLRGWAHSQAALNAATVACMTELTARSLAARALLQCLISAHPSPGPLLELYLDQMNSLSDPDPEVTLRLADAFGVYVRALSARANS